MIVYVDIDETICMSPDNRDYSLATPLTKRIEKINKLHDEGNYIVFWTARGTGSGLDWEDITHSQLEEWGVKYHELKFQKPIYDIFICDKAIESNTFFNGGE